MSQLLHLDEAVFRWLNQALVCGPLDWLMPWLSGSPVLASLIILLALGLLLKGGPRGRLCLVMALLLVGVGNNALIGWLKGILGRARPFETLEGVRLIAGTAHGGSLPSGHTANWFAALAVIFWYYRRTAYALLPVAAAVGLSRVYLGVHYPSDVLAGALIGLTVGGGGVLVLDWLWRMAGSDAFPIWWRAMPSLIRAEVRRDPLAPIPGHKPLRDPDAVREHQWLRLGYLFIAGMLLARLVYIASGIIELSEDEAYQWVWSKHLALSYYSKPPMIAYLQWAGTHLWGDTELGVRFFSPVITAALSLALLRFFAREVSARAGFFLLLCLSTAPLISVGSVLMTIDPPLVLCWTLAMLHGWKGVQTHGRTRDWLWVGVWSGLGFLSKYSALLQWVSFFLFLGLWPTARRHLRRPGPWLAVFISLIAAVPVVVWNVQHDWITVTHLQDRAGLTHAWQFTDFFKFLGEFTGATLFLLNPVFAVAIGWACAQVWRHRRHDGLLMYCLAMGAPLFVGYWLYTVRARVHPNWIAPAIVPLFCVLVAYADSRWRELGPRLRPWLVGGLIFGGLLVGLLHETKWVAVVAGRPLPAKLDPLRRVRQWSNTAQVVEAEREKLARSDGKPVFIIADHYGLTGELSFYLPGHRARTKDDPSVYYQTMPHPVNQFWFYQGYRDRVGQNALYVVENRTAIAAPENIVAEFNSVTDLGVHDIKDGDRVMHRVQIFVCRGLR